MIKEIPSIFNDVIGPVMRGPSSSHTAAALRIGKIARQMVNGNLTHVINDFNKDGSLATTYHGHGSDIGIAGGVLDFEANDSRLVNALEEAKSAGVEVTFNIIDYKADHPNTYKMTMKSDIDETVSLTAISVGGGMIEIQDVDGIEVSIKGDFYEALVFFDNVDCEILNKKCEYIKNIVNNFDYCTTSINNKKGVVVLKTQEEINKDVLDNIKNTSEALNIISLNPVLPTMSHKDCEVPFLTSEKMLEVAEKENLELWEAAVSYESKRGNISKQEVFDRMKEIVNIMINSVEEGLKGTEYENRILGPQSWMIEEAKKQSKLIPGDVLNRIIASITAIMEVKSSMGAFVAAPTAGSCGGLPGTIIGTAMQLGKNIDEITKAMLASGMIGIFIAEHATFAGEVGGCQAECGSGSGMAAAGLVQLIGGSLVQSVDAASMALQSVLGLACDPVGSRVEVPCLGKNVLAGTNALASANMVLAGYDKVVPLDETIKAMDQVGKMIPVELRCTELAGLSVAETSKRINKKLGLC